MKHIKEWNRTSWLALSSFLVSALAFLPLFLFPKAVLHDFGTYMIITMPLGVGAAAIAYFVKSRKLTILALLAALSPVIMTFGLLLLIELTFIITDGRFPPHEWLISIGLF
ncbi:MAG: hypothetical protein Q4A82_07105 [Corynebacterium sp.]|nr:hypothetical protein [Corynebacterium sp.]